MHRFYNGGMGLLGFVFIAVVFLWIAENVAGYFKEIADNFKEGYYGEESSR